MQKNLIFILLSLIPLCGMSQIIFEKKYGGTGAEGKCYVVPTSDAGFAIAGTTQSFGAGNNDVYLVKTNSSGSVLWTKTYGGGLSDQGFDIRQTSDNGFIISGSSASFNNGYYDVYLIRTDAYGDTLWTRTYGTSLDDEGFAVQQTPDGGFIVACGYASTGKNTLIKTNSGGDTLWTRTYDQGKAFGISLTSDGGYIVTGSVYSTQFGGQDLFMYRTDSTGAALWYKVYGGNATEYGFSPLQTPDGGFIVLGHSASFTTAGDDLFLVKTDAGGVPQWSKTYGLNNYERGNCLIPVTGGYMVMGTTGLNVNYPSALLIKTDLLGSVLWAKNYSSTSFYSGFGGNIRQTFDNGFVFTGFTTDFVMIKTDSAGNSGCNDPSVTVTETVPALLSADQPYNSSNSTFVGSPNTAISSGGTSTVICISTGTPELPHLKSVFAIYPNPCTTCEIKGVKDAQDLQVTDVLGRVIPVMITGKKDGLMLHLPERNNGIYLVRYMKTGQVVKVAGK